MPDQKPTPAHYVVATEMGNQGDAFIDECVAKRHFERLSAKGQFVRLFRIEDGRRTELDRRNNGQGLCGRDRD